MSALEKEMSKAFQKVLNDKAQLLPKADLVREPSLNEQKREYHVRGTQLLFCVHGKSFFEPCNATTCRRTWKEANQRMAELVGE
jgi:hypothetical protein